MAKPKPEGWQNRIVGYDQVDPETLLANPNNWRIHSGGQQEALEGVLDTVGWVDDVIVNKRTGFVVDGHLRVSLALRHGAGVVPVKYVDLTEAEESLVLATLDPIGAMARTDSAKLKELLSAAHTDSSPEMNRILEVIARQEHLSLFQIAPDGADSEPETDASFAKWKVKLGDLWIVGQHRILCADCTDQGSVIRVMGRMKARCIFTDPPYGVSIGAKNRMLNAFQPSGRRLENIEHDDDSADDLRQMLVAAFTIARAIVMGDDCSVFVCAPQGGSLGLMMMMMMMRDVGLPIRHVLIWAKSQPTFSLGRLDYEYQHEPILFTWGKRHKRRSGEGPFSSSLWPIDRPSANPLHATTKPVALVEQAVANHTDRGDIVFDGFLGSGTTIVACERLGRRGFGLEIEPRYVAVTLERLSEMGLTPERADQQAGPRKKSARRNGASK